ncbi:MAG TPA: hypothetical protein VLB44_15010 [Kofleriaceae bacterium]|nr:hypothetical protein [Kofleriaceae bacterium]
MKALVAPLVLVMGCGRDVEMYPVNPGGGGGPSGTGMADAAITIDGSNTILGRVCLIADARTPTACASSGADALTVTLGSATATPAADGTFSIARPSGSGLVWRVSGTDIVGAAMEEASGTTIPAIGAALYADMTTTNSAINNNGTGAIIAQLTHGGAALVNATALPSPVPAGNVYYDGISAIVWSLDVTGSFGVVWVPGMTPGTAQLTIDGTAQGTITGIPVFADTVTFVAAEIP